MLNDDLSIVEPGWAGELSPSELRYLVGVLAGQTRSPHVRRPGALRARWGFRPEQQFVNESAVRAVAMGGDPEDPEHNRHLVAEAMAHELGVAAS